MMNYHFQGSVYSLPVSDNTVDCIFGVMIAQFLDLPLFFKEVDRVLKPGGVLIFHGKSPCRITETEGAVTTSEVNHRIVHIKSKLFEGLWHDRTFFNPLKYTNIPDLYPDSNCTEWIADPFSNLPATQNNDSDQKQSSSYINLGVYVDYMLTFSAAGKYCVREGMTFDQLKVKLLDMLSEGVEAIRLRCEYDVFIWYSMKPNC